MSRPELSTLNDPELVAMLEERYNCGHVEATSLDFSRRVLDGADLDGAVLLDCNFTGASLRDVVLYSSYPTRCSFVGADMTSVQMVKAQLDDCDLRDVRLVRANLLRAVGHHLDLREADISEADLTRCFLSDSDLRGAVMRDVVFRGTSIRSCHLAGADLRGAAGTLLRRSINIGTPEQPRILDGDEALDWLRAAGADVSWFVPEPR
jgi:uncharacterized protein YjbI with pentapeptide repeats